MLLITSYKKEMGEKRKTVLKIEGISNIKYEAADEFETSVSYEYYRQALEMTEEIVKNNFQIFGSEAEQSGLSGNDGTILRNNKQLYNIIFLLVKEDLEKHQLCFRIWSF